MFWELLIASVKKNKEKQQQQSEPAWEEKEYISLGGKVTKPPNGREGTELINLR